MENIYKSLFSGHEVLSGQFMQQMFELSGPEGAVMIYVSPTHSYQTNNAHRADFLQDTPECLSAICERIDDGDDPCVLGVQGGCVAGTQLAAEQGHYGYFLVFLPGYTTQTVGANMDIIELLLAEAQLVCRLIEKNNQLHHLRLDHLSKTSRVLS